MFNLRTALAELMNFANKFLTDLGFEFTLQPWMVVVLAVVGILVIAPALLVASSIGLGFELQNLLPIDKGITYIVAFVAVISASYLVLYAIGSFVGKLKFNGRRLKDEDVILYQLHHYELPRYDLTTEEKEKMNYTIFLQRKKIRKFIFNTDINVHVPSNLDEKTRAFVIQMKEFVLANQFHKLSDQQKRQLMNKHRLNNPGLDRQVQESMQAHYLHNQAQFQRVVATDDNVFIQQPTFSEVQQVQQQYQGNVVLKQPVIVHEEQVSSYNADKLFYQGGMKDISIVEQPQVESQKDIYDFFRKK